MILANVAAALPGERDFRLVDIFIKGGKIASIKEASIKKRIENPPKIGDPGTNEAADPYDYEDILDAHGLLAFPGAIDTSRRLSAWLCGIRARRCDYHNRYALHFHSTRHL